MALNDETDDEVVVWVWIAVRGGLRQKSSASHVNHSLIRHHEA
jgi:hypothetical protein